MPRVHRPAVGSLLVTCLRRGRGKEQKDLAADSGRSESQINAWENSEEPSWPTLVELLVDTLDYDLSEVEELHDDLLSTEGLKSREGSLPRVPPSPIPITKTELREIRRYARALGRAVTVSRAALAIREIRERKVLQARAEAEALCSAWFARPPAQRDPTGLAAVGAARLWAVAQCLAEHSTRAAANSCEDALRIAGLACKVARLVPGGEAWRLRILAFCLAFLANAWRVAGKIKRAERLFRQVWRLWHQGEAGDPDRILPEWRLLDLETSLKRVARDFPAALALNTRAREAAPREVWGQILVNRACTFSVMGVGVQVLEVLAEAAPLLREGNDSRLQVYASLLECDTLCRLANFEAAERLLGATWSAAAAAGNKLELTKLRWLSGRVEAGTGRPLVALESYRAVRRHFEEEKMAFDLAHASMEEAELRLSLGHFDRVKKLVTREMVLVFAGEGIHEAALAALTLFRKAVEGGTATAELARRIHHYLERARFDPTLQFEQ